MSEGKKFISDVGVTFVASAVTMLLAFPITVLLGRYLGADELGLYRMVNTIFGITMLFVTIGIPVAVTKYVAEFRDNDEKIQQIVSSGVITSAVVGIVSFLLMYSAAGILADIFDMPRLFDLIRILAFVFPFSVVNTMLLGLLNGLREMNKNAWVTMVKSALLLMVTFLLIFRYGVEGAVLGIVLSSVITTMLLIVIQKRFRISWDNYLATTRMMISFGSKTLLANAVNLVNYQADILMIGYFLTEKDVGIYSVAVMFAKLIWILPDSIQRITFPQISEYHAKKMHESIKVVVDMCMKYSCLFLIFCSTFFFFFGHYIVELIFGAEFEQAIAPLNILLIGIVFYGITKSVGSIFASIGEIDLVYKIPIISAIANLILNAALIPVYGIKGGAIATSISLLISTILMLYFMKRLVDIRIDYGWYSRVFMVTAVLMAIDLTFSSSSHPILLGMFLIIVECIIFAEFFVPAEHKKKVCRLVGVHFK
ncbi:flippase [Methanococcoides sp. SA1]|nr:flippase [Methanococcoides sp. SA1]